MESKILNLLKEQTEPLDALQVSKKVVGSKGTKKDVNRFLYKLEKEGKINKLAPPKGVRPLWQIKA